MKACLERHGMSAAGDEWDLPESGQNKVEDRMERTVHGQDRFLS
jgi:hypothetical protein